MLSHCAGILKSVFQFPRVGSAMSGERKTFSGLFWSTFTIQLTACCFDMVFIANFETLTIGNVIECYRLYVSEVFILGFKFNFCVRNGNEKDKTGDSALT